MRIVDIDFTGEHPPVTFFVGYTGEVNNTQLRIRLPESLSSPDVHYYKAVFKTDAGESIRSEKLYTLTGLITLTMGFALLRYAGTLLMQLSAFDFNGIELLRLGKTPVVALTVRPSLPPGVETSPATQSIEAELETLLRTQSGGNFPVMVNTFTDLPEVTEPGTLALVRNPPPRFVQRSVRPILGYTNYPRLYINPYPPRPEHVFTGDDMFPESAFSAFTDDSMGYTMSFYFGIFDGAREGLPTMLQMATAFEEGSPLYVYAWDAFDLDEDLHIVPGWYRAYINFETGEPLSVESMDIDELPIAEYAGRTESSSVYLGYYLSPDPYFEHTKDALYMFDRQQWRRIEDTDISIPALGAIPVRGIEFEDHTITCTVGYPYQLPKARVFPFFATNRAVTYTISDETIFTLSWDEDEQSLWMYLVGLKAGTATLTATTADGGFSKTRTVTFMEE